jgi:hypothetical protein
VREQRPLEVPVGDPANKERFAAVVRDGWTIEPNPTPVLRDGRAYHVYILSREA